MLHAFLTKNISIASLQEMAGELPKYGIISELHV